MNILSMLGSFIRTYGPKGFLVAVKSMFIGLILTVLLSFLFIHFCHNHDAKVIIGIVLFSVVIGLSISVYFVCKGILVLLDSSFEPVLDSCASYLTDKYMIQPETFDPEHVYNNAKVYIADKLPFVGFFINKVPFSTFRLLASFTPLDKFGLLDKRERAEDYVKNLITPITLLWRIPIGNITSMLPKAAALSIIVMSLVIYVEFI